MRTTVSLSDANAAYAADRADEDDSNADAIRGAVDRARELEGRERAIAADARDRITEHQDRIDDLTTELERVKNEKRTIINQREQTKELAKFAESERSKRERLAAAGVLTSIKWRITGVPDSEN